MARLGTQAGFGDELNWLSNLWQDATHNSGQPQYPRPIGPKPIQGPGLGHHPGETRPKPRPKPNKGSVGSVPSGHRPLRPATSTRGGPGRPANAASGTANGVPGRTVRRPQTFTDGNGVVRRVRTAPTTRAAKPAKDPIKTLVDEIIAGMNTPLENDRKALVEQSAGNINQTNRLSDFYDQQVSGIAGEANVDFGAMLQRAAELKGISADTIAKNQDWLKSLTADGNGGTMEQQVAQAGAETQGQMASYNDQLGREIAQDGQTLAGTMGQLRVAGRAQQREMNQQELLRRAAGQREIDRAKAENLAKAPQMRYEMQAAQDEAALKQAVAEKEWGLELAKLQSQDDYRRGQLALGAARLDGQGGSASKPEGERPGRFGNIPKKYDAAIQKVYDSITTAAASGDSKQPWRDGFEHLVDLGVPVSGAAVLMSKWFPGSMTRSNPYNIRQMLANRGVPLPTQKLLVERYFGRGSWAQSARPNVIQQANEAIFGD